MPYPTDSVPRRSGSSGLPLFMAGAALVLAVYVAWDRLVPGPVHVAAEPRAVSARGERIDRDAFVVHHSVGVSAFRSSMMRTRVMRLPETSTHSS